MDFWDYIFKDPENKLEGYVRIALRRRDGKFIQQFIKWPQEKSKLIALPKASKDGDVYFCPALYKGNSSGHKAQVLGSHVAWVDLDDVPATASQGPPAGLVVASGSRGHQHRYWRSETFLEPVRLESWNLELTTELSGDPSGWDCNQLLRVPGTKNWKTKPPTEVKLMVQRDTVLTPPVEFKHSVIEVRSSSEIPVAEILLRHKLNGQSKKLLEQSSAEDRSRDLFSLSCLLFEQNLTVDEVFSLLSYADSRWGKFSKRDDKEARIAEIIGRTADRRPNVSFDLGRSSKLGELKPIGWTSLTTSERKIQWVVEGILRQKGSLLITGDAGVGKSTFLLNMAARLGVQATSFAGFNVVDQPQKILYGSHEMDEAELNYFIGHLSSVLNDEVRQRLEENVHFIPSGHPIYLDTDEGRSQYEQWFKEGEYTGFMLDTLGASVSSSLSDEATARAICDWLDYCRQEFGIWVAALHHPRKATPGAKTGTRLDDTFGSRLFVDRANTVLHIKRGRHPNTLELHSHKSRLSQQSSYRILTRTSQLWLELREEVPVGSQSVTDNQPTLNNVSFEIDQNRVSSDDGFD